MPDVNCMHTCPGVLYELHMVSVGSVPMMCFAPKKVPNTQRLYSLGVLAESEETINFLLARGNVTPSPVEH